MLTNLAVVVTFPAYSCAWGMLSYLPEPTTERLGDTHRHECFQDSLKSVRVQRTDNGQQLPRR